MLSPYHAMGCNPVSMVDPLGLQAGMHPFTKPLGMQDPAAFARSIAPTLAEHAPGGSKWGLSNMARYISTLPSEAKGEAWLQYLTGGAGGSLFKENLTEHYRKEDIRNDERRTAERIMELYETLVYGDPNDGGSPDHWGPDKNTSKEPQEEAIYKINDIRIVKDRNGNDVIMSNDRATGAVETVHWELTFFPGKAIYNGIKSLNRIAKIYKNSRDLVYNESALTKPDIFHNFPRSFDRTITRTGESSWHNGGLWYTTPGTIQRNGYLYQGRYEIGVGTNGIYHRNFVPINKIKLP